MDRAILKAYKEMIQVRFGQQEEHLAMLKELKSKKKDDRLTILKKWWGVYGILSENIISWGNILQNNDFLQNLDQKDLREIYDGFWEFVEAFVNFDIYTVEEVYDKIVDKLGKPEDSYIA